MSFPRYASQSYRASPLYDFPLVSQECVSGLLARPQWKSFRTLAQIVKHVFQTFTRLRWRAWENHCLPPYPNRWLRRRFCQCGKKKAKGRPPPPPLHPPSSRTGSLCLDSVPGPSLFVVLDFNVACGSVYLALPPKDVCAPARIIRDTTESHSDYCSMEPSGTALNCSSVLSMRTFAVTIHSKKPVAASELLCTRMKLDPSKG